MEAHEREFAAMRLRQIADDVGLELSAERLERLVNLMESTVDGVRAGAELGLEGLSPAIVPDLDDELDEEVGA